MEYDRFWPEVKRVLKPGGTFSAWGYCWAKTSSEVDEVMQNAFLDFTEPRWAEQNNLLWRHDKELEIPFRRIQTPDFEMDWNSNQLFAYLCSWSATGRCIDVVSGSFSNEAYRQVLAVWGNPGEHKRVEMDFCRLVAKNEI